MCLLVLLAGAGVPSSARGESPAAQIEIPNFGKVNEHLYRGAQPDEKQYAALAALGIGTIIDLRDDARPWARRSAERAGIRYVNLRLSSVVPPTSEEGAYFLQLVKDSVDGPVFVHCAGGRHRTGVLVALYRMVVDGWTAERAYEEMKQYKFYSALGHGRMKDYVFDSYRALVESAAHAAGSAAPALARGGGGQQD